MFVLGQLFPNIEIRFSLFVFFIRKCLNNSSSKRRFLRIPDSFTCLLQMTPGVLWVPVTPFPQSPICTQQLPGVDSETALAAVQKSESAVANRCFTFTSAVEKALNSEGFP